MRPWVTAGGPVGCFRRSPGGSVEFGNFRRESAVFGAPRETSVGLGCFRRGSAHAPGTGADLKEPRKKISARSAGLVSRRLLSKEKRFKTHSGRPTPEEWSLLIGTREENLIVSSIASGVNHQE